MNKAAQIAVLVVLGVGVYVSMNSIYTVSEIEQMIVTQLASPSGIP